VASDTEQLRERLEAIAEELADLALDALREALAAGAEKRPDAEKRLTQARRAVEKAAGLLKPREPDAL
jgi:exonuclease VII small subunit